MVPLISSMGLRGTKSAQAPPLADACGRSALDNNGSPPQARAEEHPQMPLRAQKGDSQTFVGLYAALRLAFKDFTVSMVGQSMFHDQEELAYEVFLRTWENRSAYRGEASAKTWLFSIAQNTFRERLRRKQRDSALIEAAMREAAQHQPTDSPGPDLAELLGGFQSRLPPSQKEAIQLVVVKGVPVAQAAQQAGCSVGAMYQRLHEARKCLRELVARLR